MWRCEPLGKKFGRAGQHMNVAWRPRRAQIAFTVLRKRIMASAAARPSIGLNVISICPGPHSFSIERGGMPASMSPSRIASSAWANSSMRLSERNWYPRSIGSTSSALPGAPGWPVSSNPTDAFTGRVT